MFMRLTFFWTHRTSRYASSRPNHHSDQHLPPYVIELAQSSVSSQVQLYSPGPDVGEVLAQVHEPGDTGETNSQSTNQPMKESIL